MGMTSAEKVRAFRERQKLLSRRPVCLYLTDEERFYVERVLEGMREGEGTPAMFRNSRGQLKPIDV